MATYTDNYQYTKPTMAESADIRVINSNFDKVDTIEHATQISLAPAYDPTEEYDAGAVVMFEFLMYQCDEDGATGTFDPTKWHRVTAADVGAGGTEVEANPAGTPTETLQTIGIAGTIYEIEGGGGGGGGGSSEEFKNDLLWSGTAGSQGAAGILSAPISNYPFLFMYYVPADTPNEWHLEVVDVAKLTDYINNTFSYEYYKSAYIRGKFTDSTHFSILQVEAEGASYPILKEIRGVDFRVGSGSGSAYEMAKIWDYVDDNAGAVLFGTFTTTLHQNINNFDTIIIENMSSSGDSGAWDATNLFAVDVRVLNGCKNPNYINYTSFGERSSRYYIKDATFQKTTDNIANTNGLVRVYGIKYGQDAAATADEVQTIEAGTGTTSRTFTLSKTPKKITMQGYTSGDGGWYETGSFIWGEDFINLYGAQRTAATGGYVGQAAITYGNDGKSFTITASNAFGAFNRSDNFTGKILAEYGEGGAVGGGGMTVLDNMTRTALNTSFELAESILNFDFLIILTRWTGGSGDSFTGSFNMPVPQIEYNTGIYIDGGNNDRMSQITFTDATHYEIISHNTATDAVVGVYGVKAGGVSRSDDLSEREWTLLAATTGTSSAAAIPAGTEFLVLTAELGGIVSQVAKESIKNINKLLNVSQLSTWNQGYEYADTAGNHTTISMSITAGAVTIRSGYNTVTAKVYAIS